VSRLFPERVTVRFAPRELQLERKIGFFRRKIATASLECDGAFGAEPWHGAVAALESAPLDFRCRVSVVLANAFVRYAILPWNDSVDEGEEEAYIRHHFVRIHGERAKGWAVRAAEAGGGKRLASAIDRALLDSLKRAFGKHPKARLVSVQPELMQRFNAARRAVPSGGAWLVLAEPDRACIALHAGGVWRAVLSGKGDWLGLLERERMRLGGEQPALVLLSGAVPPEAASGWTFRPLAAS
jgi:hypothetical protein